jgi:hypothetical protein
VQSRRIHADVETLVSKSRWLDKMHIQMRLFQVSFARVSIVRAEGGSGRTLTLDCAGEGSEFDAERQVLHACDVGREGGGAHSDAVGGQGAGADHKA